MCFLPMIVRDVLNVHCFAFNDLRTAPRTSADLTSATDALITLESSHPSLLLIHNGGIRQASGGYHCHVGVTAHVCECHIWQPYLGIDEDGAILVP